MEIELAQMQICAKEYQIKRSNDILMEALEQIDEICKKPCNFLKIHTGARNFGPVTDTRWYGYFIPKVPVR